MKKLSKPILFFGSGPVAAESLRLLAEYCEIEAVITKPRPAHHHGDVPVLRIAAELKLPVHTVRNRRELDMLIAETSFQSDLGVLIDFGIIVSQTVIDAFPRGIINSHFSLLPEWRGADPITFSILSGQAQTGISLMLLTAGMDEGPILAYAQHPIGPETTTPTLTHDLILLSDATLQSMLPLYLSGKAIPVPQDESTAPTYSRKLTKSDGIIDWNKPAQELEREIRAFAEWPKSHAVIDGKPVILLKTHVVDQAGRPGSIAPNPHKTLIVFCAQQALAIDELKPAGKQTMTGVAFAAGYLRK